MRQTLCALARKHGVKGMPLIDVQAAMFMRGEYVDL
jgi:hypothetical protein